MGEGSDQTPATAQRRRCSTPSPASEPCSFDVTWTNAAGDKNWFPPRLSPPPNFAAPCPRCSIDAARQAAQRDRAPGRPAVTFVQLDDLDADKLARVAPAVFLTLETSPGIFRHGLAIPGSEDKDFVRRLRKGAGADATASGATRVAGSLNFKAKYAPDFPRVAIRAAHPGRMTNAAELERLGLVAAPEMVARRCSTPAPARVSPGSNRKWPSYAMPGRRAAQQRGNGPDTSRADFVWCMTAITWGWSVEETARRLMEETDPRRRRGSGYAELPPATPLFRAAAARAAAETAPYGLAAYLFTSPPVHKPTTRQMNLFY